MVVWLVSRLTGFGGDSGLTLRGGEAELRNKEGTTDRETRRQRMTRNTGDDERDDIVEGIGTGTGEGRNLERRRERGEEEGRR